MAVKKDDITEDALKEPESDAAEYADQDPKSGNVAAENGTDKFNAYSDGNFSDQFDNQGAVDNSSNIDDANAPADEDTFTDYSDGAQEAYEYSDANSSSEYNESQGDETSTNEYGYSENTSDSGNSVDNEIYGEDSASSSESGYEYGSEVSSENSDYVENANDESDAVSEEFDEFGNPAGEEAVAASVEEQPSTVEDGPQWGATMTVGGTVYATTIFWQPLQDPDNPLPEVKETAENVLENADLYVIRPTGTPQYGLGISAEGHKPGMPVAALALADAFSDLPSSVSVFKVPEGWWFVAIRNDLILSEDDMLYRNEDDAKRTFLSMMAVPDWGRKVAPKEWGIEDTEEMDIAEVFKETPKIKLLKIKDGFNVKTVAILAIVIIALAWGGFTLLSHFSGTEEIIEEVVPPPVAKPVAEKPKVTTLPMPWESIVIPADFMGACEKSTSQLVAARAPGWVMGDVTCQQTGLSTSWNMVKGRLGNFQTAFKIYDIEGLNFSISESGRQASGSINFGSLRKTFSEPTLKTEEIVMEWTDIFQALNIPLTINTVHVSPDPNQSNGPQQEPYSYVNFSFSSNLPVRQWGIFFSNFDALELTSMVYSVNSNVWKYEGKIYGKK